MSLEKVKSSENDSHSKEYDKVNDQKTASSRLNPDDEKTATAYRMCPSLADTFKSKIIKEIIQRILTKTLQGQKYNIEDARKWTTEIGDSVSASVKELSMPRYKHVVQVILGQQLGAGCKYIAKCSWDAECDSYTSDMFSNASLFCVCTVFGVYVY